jgi:hypothetical protein
MVKSSMNPICIYTQNARRRVDFGRKKGTRKSLIKQNQPPAACDFFSEHSAATSDPMWFVNRRRAARLINGRNRRSSALRRSRSLPPPPRKQKSIAVSPERDNSQSAGAISIFRRNLGARARLSFLARCNLPAVVQKSGNLLLTHFLHTSLNQSAQFVHL